MIKIRNDISENRIVQKAIDYGSDASADSQKLDFMSILADINLTIKSHIESDVERNGSTRSRSKVHLMILLSEINTLISQYEETIPPSAKTVNNVIHTSEFKRGYNEALKQVQYKEKEYNKVYNLLLEIIGYDKEWLTTEAGLRKFSKGDLIEVILTQRTALKELYSKLSKEEQNNLKNKVEQTIWPMELK